METKRLQEVLSMHKEWSEDPSKGCKANLVGADLREADLRGADLREANLVGANLGRANLREANLGRADLMEADLRGADLVGANLRGTDLRGADYGVLDLLRSYWGGLSEALTLELMRHDAELCGDDAMEKWVKTGACPFRCSGRGFFFLEDKRWWAPGPPKLRGKTLLEALAAECHIRL